MRRIGDYGNQSGKQFWVYFTSPHPRDMTDDVIEVIAAYDCLAKQIHLPVQSGDDRVLMRMNRKHAMDKYRHIVHTIRRLIPQATLFTDIIVGFTGETEEQFENTRKAMEEFKYNMAYIAQYSVRPGAASSRWEDDIPKAVKKKKGITGLPKNLPNTAWSIIRSLLVKRWRFWCGGVATVKQVSSAAIPKANW